MKPHYTREECVQALYDGSFICGAAIAQPGDACPPMPDRARVIEVANMLTMMAREWERASLMQAVLIDGRIHYRYPVKSGDA